MSETAHSLEVLRAMSKTLSGAASTRRWRSLGSPRSLSARRSAGILKGTASHHIVTVDDPLKMLNL
jgi:hypothetical protein